MIPKLARIGNKQFAPSNALESKTNVIDTEMNDSPNLDDAGDLESIRLINPATEEKLSILDAKFPKIIPFDSLARCGDEIWIENNSQIYRLRKTKQGKLILTK